MVILAVHFKKLLGLVISTTAGVHTDMLRKGPGGTGRQNTACIECSHLITRKPS